MPDYVVPRADWGSGQRQLFFSAIVVAAGTNPQSRINQDAERLDGCWITPQQVWVRVRLLVQGPKQGAAHGKLTTAWAETNVPYNPGIVVPDIDAGLIPVIGRSTSVPDGVRRFRRPEQEVHLRTIHAESYGHRPNKRLDIEGKCHANLADERQSSAAGSRGRGAEAGAT